MQLRKISLLPLASVVLILFNSSLSLVRAQEFVISGNGSGSDNTITAQSTTTTTVTQTNDAQVTNNVAANADTGNNSASQNTGGDASITTGDISTQTNIQNTANSSSVSLPCCQTQPSDITISGNGSGSQNSVDLNQTNTLNITVDNNASIYNGVYVNANTGDNTANYNGGNVSIDTGNISVKTGIKNGPVNVYNVVGGIGGGGVSASIADNASFSTNIISATVNNSKNATINSIAQLGNIIFVNANTGDNHANGNLGDVSIKTGDISIDSTINNDPINVGSVDFSCCEITPTPSPTPTPSDGGGGGSSDGGGSSGGGGDSGSSSSAGPAVLGLSFTGSGTEMGVVTFAGIAMIIGGILATSQSYGKKKKAFYFI